MEIQLKYHYGIEKPYIIKNNDKYVVKCKNGTYLLYEIDKINELFAIEQILNQLKIKDYFYKVKKTIRNEPTIIYKNKYYVLFEENIKESKKIDQVINDVRNIKINVNNDKYICLNRVDWYNLWKNKIDYYLTYTTEDYQYRNELFDYYIGMAENAIQYISKTIKKSGYTNLYLSYKRIDLKAYKNPLNLVLDVKERNVAEYLKFLFLSNNYNIESIESIINRIKKENLSTELVYARLLFPTYFFDIYETNNSEENNYKIKQLYINIEKYEKFLQDIYIRLNTIKNTKKIDWIN